MIARRVRGTRLITLLFVVGLIVSAALLGGIAYVVGHDAIRGQIDARIEAEMGSLRHLLRQGGNPALLEALDKIDERGGGFDYVLVNAEGRRLSGERRYPLLAPGWQDTVFHDDAGAGIPVRALTAHLGDGLRLTVAADTAPATALLRTTILLFALASLVLIALAIGCGLLFERAIRRRLDRMNQTAVAIIAGHLHSRITPSGYGDEFDRLADTFNSMFGRIEALIGNLRQVSSDVAHELRTPITHLQNRLERALEEIPEGTPGLETVDAAIEDSERILSLFSALLRISEGESGTVRRYFRTFDLSEQSAMVVESYSAVAEDKGCQLLSDIEPGILVEGDLELLSQAMINLIENAVNHNGPGTTVTLAVARRADRVSLSVSDDGRGIPEADFPLALRRFGRLGARRNSTRHGLGLPLVQAIARLHQGELELGDAGPGLRATIRIRGAGPA